MIGWGVGKGGEVRGGMGKGVEGGKKKVSGVGVLKGSVGEEECGKFGGGEVFIKGG